MRIGGRLWRVLGSGRSIWTMVRRGRGEDGGRRLEGLQPESELIGLLD
jgi:hypothetical protein